MIISHDVQGVLLIILVLGVLFQVDEVLNTLREMADKAKEGGDPPSKKDKESPPKGG